jgi:siderophore synthetase component
MCQPLLVHPWQWDAFVRDAFLNNFEHGKTLAPSDG